ncbi:MAG: PAS domain S-box protein [Goleter apudmare HA4340-LM2]|jgi:PAS domain S-box-containing protein|nr:PAS domain S-box protein [Goleter apudmare HA4340-LM2]
MNFGDFTLVQSNSQLGLQPETELEFADLLINQATDAAFCLGAKAQFLYVNDATCRITEYSHKELLAMKLQDIHIDLSITEWSEKWRHLKTKSPGSLTFESRYCTKSGQIFLAAITLTYIQHQGQEFACAFARKLSTEIDKPIVQLSELKINFVSMVCHQLRTPLNVVSFSNSLINRHLDEWTGEKIRSLLARIQASVEQINQLLDTMLFFAKAEAAKLNFEPKPLDLVQFCHELVVRIQMRSSQNRINFVSQSKCLIAHIDQEILEQILKNLLDNAIKYSPSHNSINLKLSCNNEQVTFQVEDTGIGIPPEDKQRVFEPFYRGSNINHIPGFGLGLSIVKTLLNLHGGRIAVDSDVNVCTTFTVVLPTGD